LLSWQLNPTVVIPVVGKLNPEGIEDREVQPSSNKKENNLQHLLSQLAILNPEGIEDKEVQPYQQEERKYSNTCYPSWQVKSRRH
jgi:hypothetical protein